jgi:hypothetical protein
MCRPGFCVFRCRLTPHQPTVLSIDLNQENIAFRVLLRFFRVFGAKTRKNPNPVPRKRAAEKTGHSGQNSLQKPLSVVPGDGQKGAELRGSAGQNLTCQE